MSIHNSTHSRIYRRPQKMTARDWDIARQLRADGVDPKELALAFGVTSGYMKEMTR